MAKKSSSGERYKWAAQPPPQKRPDLPLVRVRAGRAIQCVCLSDQVEGLLVHFLGGRTRACVGSSDSCEGCLQGWNPRWKGYLAVFFPTINSRVYLAELTPKAFETLQASAPGLESLRRSWLLIERAGSRPNSKVTAQVLAKPKFDGALPAVPDVREAIAYILEAPDRRLPVDPPSDRQETQRERQE